ncbi:hypothetical protein IAF28_21215, partial [Acinetobacter baumannii]|nr:hypothetical protein [Acinetobacter baumannii]
MFLFRKVGKGTATEKDLELRGPGELLGTKQTGDMGFRVARLERDDHLLSQAHYVA